MFCCWRWVMEYNSFSWTYKQTRGCAQQIHLKSLQMLKSSDSCSSRSSHEKQASLYVTRQRKGHLFLFKHKVPSTLQTISFYIQYVQQLPLQSTYWCMHYAYSWNTLLHSSRPNVFSEPNLLCLFCLCCLFPFFFNSSHSPCPLQPLDLISMCFCMQEVWFWFCYLHKQFNVSNVSLSLFIW